MCYALDEEHQGAMATIFFVFSHMLQNPVFYLHYIRVKTDLVLRSVWINFWEVKSYFSKLNKNFYVCSAKFIQKIYGFKNMLLWKPEKYYFL